MPTVDLPARLARDARSTPEAPACSAERSPGFGLRIHPSGRKAWIVRPRIKGRSRRIKGDINPCTGIRKNPKRHVARLLGAGGLARLGQALDAGEA